MFRIWVAVDDPKKLQIMKPRNSDTEDLGDYLFYVWLINLEIAQLVGFTSNQFVFLIAVDNLLYFLIYFLHSVQ